MKNFIGLKSFFERNFYKGILIDARELEKRGIFNAWKLNFFRFSGEVYLMLNLSCEKFRF